MKSLLTIAFAWLLILPAFTQEDTTNVKIGEVITVIESPESNTVTIGSEDDIIIDEKEDTTRIKVGKKNIVIIEGKDGTQVNIDGIKDDDFDFNINEEEENEKHKKFDPHWAGIEVGINNYVDNSFSMSLDPDIDYMDLNTGSSWNYNINFLNYGFGLGTDKIGIVTGLGMEWNNYYFDGDNNIQKDVDGNIESLALPYPNVHKNKLQTTYLRAPLLLEFQIPTGHKRIYISGGVVAGVKLGCNTKIVYKENGDKQKVKDTDDFNISALRYGFTAKAGYKWLGFYANYYMTPLFEENKGPELYPFSVGLTIIPF